MCFNNKPLDESDAHSSLRTTALEELLSPELVMSAWWRWVKLHIRNMIRSWIFFLVPKKLSMCILVERWLKEGDQERLKCKEKAVVLTRQTEAHRHPGENIKVQRWGSKKALKHVTLKKCRGTHTLEAKGPFIIKEVYTNLWVFFSFLLFKKISFWSSLGLSDKH